jgi:acyl-coenzyme A synthetase/AMP-(fatty) acid ligase
VNTHLSADEVAFIVADSQSKALFSSTAKREAAKAAAAKCPGLGRMFMTGPGPLPADWEPYDAVVAGYPADPVPGESSGAATLYSSGTTGQPKGILRGLPEAGPVDPSSAVEFSRDLSPAPL